MRKYENVDIIAALGTVMQINTEHYKSDFQYDIERFQNPKRRLPKIIIWRCKCEKRYGLQLV